MVHRAVQGALDVFAFFGDLDTPHHPPLQRFSELGVFEIFQHEATLIVPLSEWPVQLLVFVAFAVWQGLFLLERRDVLVKQEYK